MRSCGFVLFLMVCGIASAASVRAPVPADLHSSSETRTVNERNYTIGTELSAYVGQPVIRVREYLVQKNQSDRFVSTSDVTLKLRPFGGTTTFPAGSELAVRGIVNENGQDYIAVSFPDRNAAVYPLLVNKEGQFSGLVFNATFSKVMRSDSRNIVEYQPADLVLNRATSETVLPASGAFVNFEIVYSGSTKDEITLLYREYTPTDLARPAFTQNLVYTKTSPTIRFRDLLIRVLEAGNEQLRYVVESDGRPAN